MRKFNLDLPDNTVEVVHNFVIGEANNFVSLSLNEPGACGVLQFTANVRFAIEFNHQQVSARDKIRDVLADWKLAIEACSSDFAG